MFPLSLIADIKRGIECKYPLCCVLKFVLDIYVLMREPYKYRSKKYCLQRKLKYVPCEFHCKYILKLDKRRGK